MLTRILLLSMVFMATLGAEDNGCFGETEMDDKINQARVCSDDAARMALSDPDAAAAKSDTCNEIIVSFNTAEACKIRFGNLLLKQKKMAQMATIVKSMADPAAGNKDGLTAAMPFLIFTPPSARSIATTNANCSGSTGIQKIAGIIKMANFFADSSVMGGAEINANSNPTQVITAVSNCASGANCDAAEKQEMADTVVLLQAQACSSPSDSASTNPDNICFKAKQITNGTTDPTTILNNLVTYLNSAH